MRKIVGVSRRGRDRRETERQRGREKENGRGEGSKRSQEGRKGDQRTARQKNNQ